MTAGIGTTKESAGICDRLPRFARNKRHSYYKIPSTPIPLRELKDDERDCHFTVYGLRITDKKQLPFNSEESFDDERVCRCMRQIAALRSQLNDPYILQRINHV